MTPSNIVARIQSALGDQLVSLQQPNEKRIYIEVDPQNIRDAAQLLCGELSARFQTASGVDAPKQIEVLYHWAIDGAGVLITVRTRVHRDHPEIASITPICPAAEWIEREMWELLGITFHDHPDLRHLLLQDDWPEGKYPLRRDFRNE